MTQTIDLDKGILERLMMSDEGHQLSEANYLEAEAQTASASVEASDTFMPIVQVINIQNIATSAFLLKYNKDNADKKEQAIESEEKNNKSADRYLLILSDGEFYETRCLLLPNLNYLVTTIFLVIN
jgi:hypothetical protein